MGRKDSAEKTALTCHGTSTLSFIGKTTAGGYPIYASPLPSLDEINEWMRDREYDPQTGRIYFVSNGKRLMTGPGTITAGGYIRFHINRRSYAAHRIIWKMMTGNDPVGVIDHINGIRDDNRIENLRDVSPGDNARNAVRGRWPAELNGRRAAEKRLREEAARERAKVREERERALYERLKKKFGDRARAESVSHET